MITTIIASIATAIAGYMGTNAVFNLGQKREDRKKSYIDLSNLFNSMEFEYIDELFKCLAVDDYGNAFIAGKHLLDILRDPIKRKAHMVKIFKNVLKNNIEISTIIKDELTLNDNKV